MVLNVLLNVVLSLVLSSNSLLKWGRARDMGTDNSIADKNKEDEMMNDCSEEKNEETDTKVNDDTANIDGHADDIIKKKYYCNHP